MKEQDDYLALQLLGLECRLQRGEHLQEGGGRLLREYRAIKAELGKGLRKPKRDHSQIDRAMAEQLAICSCQACGGALKQTRSGSLRARCLECDSRWDFQMAEADTSSGGSADTCRECHAYFGVQMHDLSRDSGCGICVRCMRDIQSELLDGENYERQQQAKGFGKLSTREQFDYWLNLKGLPTDRPAPETIDYLAPILERGQDWVNCRESQPTEDRFGLLQYMVYAPAYDGLLIRAQYDGGRWAYASGEMYVGGVTHWRIARPDESDHDADPNDLPVTHSDL